eukprot:jgi/Mesen1/1069/ME000123S00242
MVEIQSFRPKDKSSLSDLQLLRASYQPELPPPLQGASVRVVQGDQTTASDQSDLLAIKRSYPLTFGQPVVELFSDAEGSFQQSKPLKVGVAFCGRQAPGGHNVVSGLFDALKKSNPASTLLGFVGGSEGLFAQATLEITAELLDLYRNQGGYDLLGRTKDQIRSKQQVDAARAACEALKLDGLVLIGGTGTSTDAAQLAESFSTAGLQTKVIAVPVTIDGDLKNQFVEADVGFDTTCKVYSQLISNICTDALSAEKYYYFVRLMGRRASHITLECALESQANMVILGEEVSTSKLTLFDITKQICDAVVARSHDGKHHGVILLPEGLIENIPEVHALLGEINDLLRQNLQPEQVESKLSPWAAALFEFLPVYIQNQLLLDRESDGSVRLSQIETEKLLAELVEVEMTRRTKAGQYSGKKFNAITHFFGYQARGSLPSNFDCNYAYALGHTAAHLLSSGANGYLATVSNLKQPVSQWRCGGVPITAMMSVKRWLRGPGVSQIGKPAVHPAKVDLRGPPYELLRQCSTSWLMEDLYRNPGPLQFEGPGSDAHTATLDLEEHNYLGKIQQLRSHLDKVRDLVRPGCPPEVLSAALSSLSSVTDILSVMASPAFRSQIPF